MIGYCLLIICAIAMHESSIIVDTDGEVQTFCGDIANGKECTLNKQIFSFKKLLRIYSDNEQDDFMLNIRLCNFKSSTSDSLIEIEYAHVLIADTVVHTDMLRVVESHCLGIYDSRLNFNRLFVIKVNNVVLENSFLLSTFKVIVESYKDLQPNFFAKSAIITDEEIDVLRLMDDIDMKSQQFIQANNVFISAKNIAMNKCEVKGSAIYLLANKLDINTSLLDAKIFRKTSANNSYFTFEKICGEEGGSGYNRGGFGLPMDKNELEIYSILCFQRSTMISKNVTYISSLDIFRSGDMGSFYNDDIIDINYGGVVAFTANSLNVDSRSIVKAVGNNIYNKEFSKINYGGSGGGSIGIITTEPAVLDGTFDLKGESSLKYINGEGAGGVFFYINPKWRTANQITNASTLEGVDLKAGDRPFESSVLDRRIFDGLRADNGTFISTPCTYSGTSVFCSPCHGGSWNPLLLNLDCLECSKPNQGVKFIDNECKNYVCEEGFIDRKYNPYCLSGLGYLFYFINNNLNLLKKLHVALIIAFILCNFVYYINKYSSSGINIKKVSKSNTDLSQEWIHIWVDGINEPKQPWHICIKNYERNISELKNGPVLLNVFRNLNKFFEWSLKDRILYSLFNCATYFISQYLRYKHKRKIYTKAVKYLKSLENDRGLLFDSLRVKIGSDRNFNNCMIKVADPQVHENYAKSFVLFLNRETNFSFVKETKQAWLINFLLLYRDIRFLKENYFSIDRAVKKIEILIRQVNPFKGSKYNRILLSNAVLIVDKVNKLLKSEDNQLRLKCGILVKYQAKGTFTLTFMKSIEREQTLGMIKQLKDERKAKKNKLAFAVVFYLQDSVIRPIPMLQTLSADASNKVYSITLFDQMLTKKKKKARSRSRTLRQALRFICNKLSSLCTSSSEYRSTAIAKVFFNIITLEMCFFDIVS